MIETLMRPWFSRFAKSLGKKKLLRIQGISEIQWCQVNVFSHKSSLCSLPLAWSFWKSSYLCRHLLSQIYRRLLSCNKTQRTTQIPCNFHQIIILHCRKYSFTYNIGFYWVTSIFGVTIILHRVSWRWQKNECGNAKISISKNTRN